MKKPITKEMIEKNAELYKNKQYDKLLEFYKTEAMDYDIADQLIQIKKVHYAFLLEDIDQALDILEYAVYDLGYWYDEQNLMSSFREALLNNSRYKQVIEISNQRMRSESYGELKEPLIYLAKEEFKNQNKFILALHGNYPYLTESNIEKSKTEYEQLYELLQGEYTVIALFSSRLHCTGFNFWFDYEEGAKEVQKHVKNISKTYNIEEKDIIFAGPSAGAGVILQGIFSKILHPKKIALFIPHLPFLEENLKKVSLLKENNIKTYIMTGDKDFCKPFADRLSQELDTIKHPHRYTIYENCGHNMPDDPLPVINEFKKYFEGN